MLAQSSPRFPPAPVLTLSAWHLDVPLHPCPCVCESVSVSVQCLVVGVELGVTPEAAEAAPGLSGQGELHLSQKSTLRGSSRVGGEHMAKEEAAATVRGQGTGG